MMHSQSQQVKSNQYFLLPIDQHWVRLELHTDMLVHRLAMQVEPSDSSYMPSLVVVSGGDTIHSLKELKTINIGAVETEVVLLQDLTEVSALLSLTQQAICYWSNIRIIT